MIEKSNFKQLLQLLQFKEDGSRFTKSINETKLIVDFENTLLIYPEDKGLTVHDKTTSNFSSPENFVVFECVHRLLLQGYKPEHIELEPRWQVGHGASGGKADILIKDNNGKSLLIIECKTAGSEFNKAWSQIQTSPTQIFSYAQQEQSTKFIAIYTSDFIDEKITSNYYLINLQDNKELLENNKQLKGYKTATTTEEIHKIWCETYQKDYTTIGLFEDNQAYKIGKTKFKASDLKSITSKDIQGKYHEFATILRKYSVSGRENAFDKLVNLFLCKATDEKNHIDALKLMWKGTAYDNPFDFQDRLQQLYKDGMEDFLGEEITYIDNKQIDEIFTVFKNKPNTTKESVKQILKKQKFFTNNDFAFIDVHNEKLFYQNFEVLLSITKIIQGISLLGSEENQFLGDMFEGFLDQGVKQHEGQFFTPMPIVKFIVNALPTITDPKVIDYACGSGHFLNEYINSNKNAQITGIEKEYRLSKIAKVSSLMYDSNIDIIYTDALAPHTKITNNSYHVLVANPPYSVKGFLETLSDKDRQKYQLINSVEAKSYSKSGAIECFFIERAKQLLTSDGVAGIILPSSILNKDTPKLYTKTREILLKSFEIKAIAEFGTGTFGKTGTNTTTLFLKRRNINQNLAQHLENMINTWFSGDFETNKIFKDNHLLAQYCQHINLDLGLYKSLLCGQFDDELFNHDTFKEYRATFENLSATKNRKKGKEYKAKSKPEQQKIEQDKLIEYIFIIEKDKLLYFGLTQHNGRVIIVKSPSKNTEIKKFLGYEWGGGKGNEGIKYLSGGLVDDEGLSSEDKRILENLQGVKSIQTPLYNPKNLNDESKINTLIKKNFLDEAINIPDELSPFVSYGVLVDMLNFDRVKFGKEINLNANWKIEIASQYPLEKIENLIVENPKSKIQVNVAKETTGEYPFFTSGEKIYSYNSFLVDGENIYLSTGGNAVIKYFNGKTSYSTDTYSLTSNNKILPKYLYEILISIIYDINSLLFKGVGLKHLQKSDFKNLKIPLPPLPIQKQIVNECQKVDKATEQAQQVIQQIKAQIAKEINTISGSVIRLDENIIEINANTYDPRNNQGTNFVYVDIDSVGKDNGIVDYKNIIKGVNAPSRARRIVKDDSVIISTVRPYLKSFAYIEKEVKNCIFSTGLAVLKAKSGLLSKFLYLLFMFSDDLMQQMERAMPKAAYPSINKDDIINFQIPVPPLKTQQILVNKIAKLEEKITQSQAIINNTSELKNKILKKYL